MKLFENLTLAAFCISACHAKSACTTKDACYSIVASPLPGRNPTLASRRVADCSSVLRTVIDDDKTVTSTTFTTIFPSTRTISSVAVTVTETVSATVSSTIIETVEETSTFTSTELAFTSFYTDQVKRAFRSFATPRPKAPEEEEEGDVLDVRDIIIVKGTRPAYASAACRDVQAYAIACLCYGVKAPVYFASPKTRIVTSTQTGTASVTVLISTTESITNTITSRVTSTSTEFETVTTTTTTTTTEEMCGVAKRAIDVGNAMSTGFSSFYYGAMETRAA